MHIISHLPARNVLGAPALKGAPVRPRAIGQGQIRDTADPEPVGLGGLGLVEEPVGSTPSAVDRTGRAQGEDLGLQRAQVLAGQGRV